MITVYTGVFSKEEQAYIQSTLASSRWQFGHASRLDSPNLFWWMDLEQDTVFTDHLFGKIQKLLKDGFKLERVYANGQTFGQDGDWHKDSDDPDAYTFLYYANNGWDTRWRGETVFQIKNKTVSYTPDVNKAIFFPGTVYHYASSPSREFHGLRMTVAFKLLKCSA